MPDVFTAASGPEGRAPLNSYEMPGLLSIVPTEQGFLLTRSKEMRCAQRLATAGFDTRPDLLSDADQAD
jgi:hypothetical protein